MDLSFELWRNRFLDSFIFYKFGLRRQLQNSASCLYDFSADMRNTLFSNSLPIIHPCVLRNFVSFTMVMGWFRETSETFVLLTGLTFMTSLSQLYGGPVSRIFFPYSCLISFKFFKNFRNLRSMYTLSILQICFHTSNNFV
jgi:hypothetical protein